MRQERRAEWVAGIVFATIAGIVLVVSTSYIESTAIRLALVGLAILATIATVIVLDTWLHVTPTQGVPQMRGGFLQRGLGRLRRRDWLAGVLLVWLVAAVVVGVLALFDPVTPVFLIAGVAVVVIAAVVFLWADLTPSPHRGERGS